MSDLAGFEGRASSVLLFSFPSFLLWRVIVCTIPNSNKNPCFASLFATANQTMLQSSPKESYIFSSLIAIIQHSNPVLKNHLNCCAESPELSIPAASQPQRYDLFKAISIYSKHPKTFSPPYKPHGHNFPKLKSTISTQADFKATTYYYSIT